MNCHNRAELAQLFSGVGAELGVAGGDYSLQILGNPRVSRLWSIDRWNDHHNLAEYKRAASKLAKCGKGRCIPLRMTFDEALPMFEDESLDFLYVDGYAHTGQEEGKTLRDWWSKLKPGGIMAGHDYATEWPRTLEAVNTFVSERGLALNVTGSGDKFPSWWCVKE